MTTTGLAKTEFDRGRPTRARGLKLVPRMAAVPRTAPFRIQISDDMFNVDPEKSNPSTSCFGAGHVNEDIELERTNTVQRLRRPIAAALVAGLGIGYLLGRLRK